VKQGLTLNQLQTQIQLQENIKHDYVALASDIQFSPDLVEITGDGDKYKPTGLFHEQMAGFCDIPRRYYDRMRQDAPALLTENVGHWLKNSRKPRLVRTLGGDARAFLSSKYLRLDHGQVMSQLFPRLMDRNDLHVESADVTPTRMHLKVVSPKIEGEVRKGDVVRAGLAISNSEVGLGALEVQFLLYRLVCTNGLIRAGNAGHGVRRYHVGKKLQIGEAPPADGLTAEGVWTRALGAANYLLDAERFRAVIDSLRGAAGMRITGDPETAVEILAKRVYLNKEESGQVLNTLLAENDLTQWGLVNAVTRTAQAVTDYDRSTELEALGGSILDLDSSQWREIAEAQPN